jgi:thiol-disulfide isomerase/thioredoxin
LPAGAVRPAKKGVLKVGPAESSWIAVLATATPEFRDDVCQIFVDRNRNGRFDDDGPAAAATPSQNEKTKAWWSSVNAVELSVPYGAGGSTEPYLVSFWSVREEGAAAPDVLRYSRRSWRSGRVTVAGVDALVAAMDANNDALFTRSDYWSVVNADAPGADKAVLSHAEARAGSRFMFLTKGDRELVLEFRSFSADGRALEFAVVDRPMTKAADRAPDDMVGEERTRPRTRASFEWLHDFNGALAQARAGGRRVFIDFETTWCGPCKTMDQWIWTDAEVAALLSAGYIGVKLDGDIEKALVTRFKVRGYPTMIIVDATGTEVTRAVGYRSSKEMIAFLNK